MRNVACRAALLEAQYESSIDGILMVDARERIVSVNARFREIWSLPESVLGGNDDAAVAAVLSKLLDPEGFVRRLREIYAQRSYRGHDEVRLRDGRVIERYTAPVFAKKRYQGRVWYFRDVTARHEAEDMRRSSQARYRELFEAEGDPAVVLDAHTRRIEDANRAAARQFACEKHELIGLKAEELDADPESAVQALKHFATGEQLPSPIERTLRRRDGTTFPAELSAGLFYEKGRLKMIGTIRDTTSRRRAADAELFRQREALQRQFVATVSHELRTPITAISGFAETLLQGGLDDEEARRDFTATILRHSRRLGRLVDDLLTLSVLDTDRAQLHLEPLDLRKFLETFATDLAPVLHRRRASLETSVAEGLQVHADAARLMQVVQNLVDNAMKFGGPGTAVRLSAARDGDNVVIAVKDEGPGIPADALTRVFEPFFRASNAQGAKGAGLGLAIARQIVSAHGGRIWARNNAKRGAAFLFTLPLERCAVAVQPS